MNTKDFLRLGVPLGEATRRASASALLRRDGTDFVAQYVLRCGDTARLVEEIKAITNPALSAEGPYRITF